jgi:hypothetical protein
MGKVIKIADYMNQWKLVFSQDNGTNVLQVYMDERTGELEVCQMNDDGEVIRSVLPMVQSVAMFEAMSGALQKMCDH